MGSTLTIAEEKPALTSRQVPAKRAAGPALAGRQRSPFLLELQGWMPSEIEAISPMVGQLMALIKTWRCVEGDEFAVELALHEALSNAVIHGNRRDPNKSVEICCRCEREKGVWLVVKDQGNGFDPNAVADPLQPEGLQAEHGRGIHLMKALMDEVSFSCNSTEVHMRKGFVRRGTPEPSTHENADQIGDENAVERRTHN
jgi:serine/threonine-protein kinase RsbW